MIRKAKVLGSQEVVPLLEYSKDTVYVRSNVKAYENEHFKGWQYEEIQYNLSEYQEIIANKAIAAEGDSAALGEMVAYLLTELEALKSEVRSNG